MTRRSNQQIWVVISIVLMACVSPATAKVIYVDANAPGPTHNGSSWANAYKYLQDALADANSATKPVEIRVAKGTYKPDQSSTDPNGTGDQTATFQLINSVTIKGGYAGFDEPDPNALDIEAYESILSGDLAGNDGPDFANNGENSYHVVTGSGTDETAVLNGLTVSSGVDSGMYNEGGSPTLLNCTFSKNSALNYSGGMYNANSSSPTLTNCTFIWNWGHVGGGMCNQNSNPTLNKCKFISNTTPHFGGGMSNWYNSNPTLTNCTFSANQDWIEGGAIYNSNSSPTLTNCILWGDTPEEIYDDNSTTVVAYSDVQGGWPGLGNIDAYPCFADAYNGDYHLKSQAGRWEPNSENWVQDYVSSPCIDAGNPGCPEANEPAPNGNRRNMGAYGGTAEASKSPGNGRNIADLTNDWAVDSNDLKVFVSYWLETGDCIPSDLDRSRLADFNDYRIFASQWLHKQDSVSIFIDSNTHSNLTSEIQRLKSDIINDLKANVFIFSDDWRDIKDIKDILIDKYNNDGLIGAIFIGQIPTAYFEYQNSGSNPTDRYFQDFSDNFIDVDGDGKFEREYYMDETDVMMREIWTGRIKPPVGRSEGIELLRDYLDRNHNYRTSNLSYDKKMLYYGSISINQDGMSQDDYNDLVNQIDDYTGLYESDDEVDSIYDTDLEMQKRTYLTALKNSYDFVFVNIHGTVWHQWLGELNPGDQCVVYYNEIKEFRPQPLFSVLASCSNGDFTTENYFAGWYLFSGNSLIVQANTTVSYLTGANTMEFFKDYIPLGLGVTFGDMDKNDRNFIVSHILGDPTLTFRPKSTGDLPSLSRYESEIDFGDVERGTTSQQYISFWNGGTATLTIRYKKAPFSINGEYVNLGYWDVFYYEHPTTGETFRDFEVRPGKCKVVPFYFYPRADGPIGRYTMTILFQTNDPENPYMEIHLSGNAI